jgi:hypothetical protein
MEGRRVSPSVRSIVLDGVPDVLGVGHRHRPIHHESDHVDAAGLLLAVGLGAIELEEHAELSPFALVDRLLGCAESDAAARLDLDEDERVAVLGDDVDLPEAAAPVACEDSEALFLEVSERGDLAGVADSILERPRRRKLLRGSRPPATLRRRSPRLPRRPRVRLPPRSPRRARCRPPPARRPRRSTLPARRPTPVRRRARRE